MKTIHAIITGKVQNVFYRDNTNRIARQLNITGWVRNKTDGSVEVTATGSEDDITELLLWLHEGPNAAHVDEVNSHEIEGQSFDEFKILESA